METAAQAIDTLLLEERRYPPPPEFAAAANAKPDIYDEGFEAFWEREGRERVEWFQPLRLALRVGAPVREVVPRRAAQRLAQLRRPSCRRGARRQGGVPLGRRAGRRPARPDVRRPAARGRRVRERVEGARREEGHRGRDLHGDGPGAAGRHARVHAPRRSAHGRIRRFLRRLALVAHERHGLRGPDHPGRGLAARLDRPVEADRRRGDGRRARRQALPRRAPDRQRGSDDRGPRRLVPRRPRLRRPGLVPARADGRRGPVVPHVHVGARPRSRRGSRIRPPAIWSASRRRTTTSST